MAGRNRISFDVKAKAVQRVWDGETKSKVARDIGVSNNIVCDWVLKAEIHGIEFLSVSSHPKYSISAKVAMVEDLMASSKSVNQYSRELGLSSHTLLQRWILEYKNGNLLEKLNREKLMTRKKAHKFNLEEKTKIVKWTLTNKKDYLGASRNFGASYQQVNNWVKKYEKDGIQGLQDNRGHRKPVDSLSEAEYWKHKYEESQKELKKRDIASELLKKYREIERRPRI